MVAEILEQREGFARYRVIEELGRRSEARLYQAEHLTSGRRVVIKTLPAGLLKEAAFADRMEKELRILAWLQHASILPVIEFGTDAGFPYIVMPYMSGGSLAQRIDAADGALSLRLVLRTARQIGEGLDYIHQYGIIHRNIKPQNILFDEAANALLSDFGATKVTQSAARVAGSRDIGSAAYVAPELAEQDALSPLADIYSFAVVVFEMLAGQPPFAATMPMGVMMAHISQPIPVLTQQRPGLPANVQNVLEKGMAKDPAERYQKAGELAADLARCLTASPVVSRSYYSEVTGEAISLPVTVDFQIARAAAESAREALDPDEADPADFIEERDKSTKAVVKVITPPRFGSKPVRPRSLRRNTLWIALAVAALGIAAYRLYSSMNRPELEDAGMRSGFAATPVTDSDSADLYPAFSPDGERLAFASDRDGDFDIYALTADGHIARLTDFPGDEIDPAFSRDGGLAFASDMDGDFDIYILDGQNTLIRITDNESQERYPAFSWNGDLAYSSDQTGNEDIWVFNQSKQEAIQYTHSLAQDTQPAFSPSGQLVFASNRDGTFDIFSLDAEGETLRLTDHPADDLYPAFSPFPGEMVFSARRDFTLGVYQLNSTGSVSRLIYNTATNLRPAFSPDGERLAFASDHDGDFEIYILE